LRCVLTLVRSLRKMLCVSRLIASASSSHPLLHRIHSFIPSTLRASSAIIELGG
jgi:hypothetical protein